MFQLGFVTEQSDLSLTWLVVNPENGVSHDEAYFADAGDHRPPEWDLCWNFDIKLI